MESTSIITLDKYSQTQQHTTTNAQLTQSHSYISLKIYLPQIKSHYEYILKDIILKSDKFRLEV